MIYLPLTILFSILVLAAAQINTNEIKECEINYSFLNGKNCNQITNCICENDHIESL